MLFKDHVYMLDIKWNYTVNIGHDLNFLDPRIRQIAKRKTQFKRAALSGCALRHGRVPERGSYIVMICEFSTPLGDMNNDGNMDQKDASVILKRMLILKALRSFPISHGLHR